MPISSTIKVKTDYSKSSNTAFALICGTVCANTYGNSYFPKPPVPFEDFRGKFDDYLNRIAAAGDGGRIAISKRDSVRTEMAKMFRQLGHYVEAACDNDDAIFQTSGFERIPDKRQPPQPLKIPRFVLIAHGPNEGTVKITLPPALRKVKGYEILVRVAGSDPASDPERVETVTQFKGPFTITGLQPTIRYSFQLRALGALGWTDYCDPVLFICT